MKRRASERRESVSLRNLLSGKSSSREEKSVHTMSRAPYTTRLLFSYYGRQACEMGLCVCEGVVWETRARAKSGRRAQQIFTWFSLPSFHPHTAKKARTVSPSRAPNWDLDSCTSRYRNKYCGSSPGLFCCSRTAHVPSELFISLEEKTSLSGWMVGKLRHSTHLHCRAGSERNFFPISCGSRIEKEKRLGVWTQEKSSKLHNFRVLRDFFDSIGRRGCFSAKVRIGGDVQWRSVKQSWASLGLNLEKNISAVSKCLCALQRPEGTKKRRK